MTIQTGSMGSHRLPTLQYIIVSLFTRHGMENNVHSESIERIFELSRYI